MRLLVVTQAVDTEDQALGFFVRWLLEFGKHAEHIHVICLKEGAHDLPKHISIHSLGKTASAASERSGSRIVSRVVYLWRFYRYVWTLRRDYDAVFVHMNPEYVILGAPLWKAWHKRIALWYVHRAVGSYLRLAVQLADVVYTATGESLQLRNKKIRRVGHGVDTEHFKLRAHAPTQPRFVSVGRITPIKELMVLIEAAHLLRQRGISLTIDLVGAPVTTADRAYERELRARITERGLQHGVRFAGAIPHARMPDTYAGATASVNLAPTGGMDKAVLESLACGVPVFVQNRAFRSLMGDANDAFLFTGAEDLAHKVERFLAARDQRSIDQLAEKVRKEFSLSNLVVTFVRELE